LYEIKNKNCLLFLKRNILNVKMEENESVTTFISRLKELKNKLSGIGYTLSNIDLATITMNSIPDDYQMFIACLNTCKKAPNFK